jgi:hypothetical protein
MPSTKPLIVKCTYGLARERTIPEPVKMLGTTLPPLFRSEATFAAETRRHIKQIMCYKAVWAGTV